MYGFFFVLVSGTLSLIPKGVTKCCLFSELFNVIGPQNDINNNYKVPSVFLYSSQTDFHAPEVMISSFFGQMVDTNCQVLLRHISGTIRLCNAVCFCHFHIIFWLMHISAVLFFLPDF